MPDDVDDYRVDDFEPLEISAVAVPADSQVGIGRADDAPFDLRGVQITDEDGNQIQIRGDQGENSSTGLGADDREVWADEKNKKYKIGTKEHALTAWSFLAMKEHADKYSAEELSAIKSRVKAALAKFGVTVNEDKERALDLVREAAIFAFDLERSGISIAQLRCIDRFIALPPEARHLILKG